MWPIKIQIGLMIILSSFFNVDGIRKMAFLFRATSVHTDGIKNGNRIMRYREISCSSNRQNSVQTQTDKLVYEK